MIRHIVAWNYKKEFSDAQNLAHVQQIKTALESLPAIIKEIVSINVILNPAKTSNRDVVLMSFFETEEDLAHYRVHPEHVKVSQFVGTVMQDRVCLDIRE